MTSVIVVDDDKDTVEVFCQYLEIKGIDVIGRGHNGREAVELYEELRPDVVLSDVVMPDFDGYYGLQKILDFDPKAKIIMVTASALSNDERIKMKSMGASDVLYKPYEIDDVIKTIEKISRVVISKSTN